MEGRRGYTADEARRARLAVLVLLCLFLLPWLGLTLYNSKGEPREAIVAVSILESGDWILPMNYGGDIPYKPPMMAWLIAVLAKVLNGGVVNEYLSRLPSALASICMGVAGCAWAGRARGLRFGVMYALVGATCFEVFRASTACRLDMLLTAFMVGAMYMMFGAREAAGDRRRRAWMYAGAWVLLSCATLTKGPVGALLPCAATGAWRLLRGDRFFPTLLKMLGLSVAALALPALWYAGAYERGGERFLQLAYEENIGRLTGTMSYDSHVKPLWYNFVTLAAGLLPWTLVAAGALAMRPWRGWRPSLRGLREMSAAGGFALVGATVIFVFYCVPESKRSVYLLPMYPFVCYGLTLMMERYRASRLMRVAVWALGSLAVIVPAGFLIAGAVGAVPAELDRMPAWGPVIALGAAATGVAAIRRRGKHAAAGSVVCAMALYTFYASTAMPMVLNPRSDARLVGRVEEIFGHEGPIYSYGKGEGERLYTLNFYTGDRLRALEGLDGTRGPVLLLNAADTTAARAAGMRTELVAERSCDHRRALWAAR
ncbi:MAG: glycosyltransferase family 39 protein [Muribaculaceae bacterium]|nr:glycosyltransferase family 39 protein [Muribaculaceae bacterium]